MLTNNEIQESRAALSKLAREAAKEGRSNDLLSLVSFELHQRGTLRRDLQAVAESMLWRNLEWRVTAPCNCAGCEGVELSKVGEVWRLYGRPPALS